MSVEEGLFGGPGFENYAKISHELLLAVAHRMNVFFFFWKSEMLNQRLEEKKHRKENRHQLKEKKFHGQFCFSAGRGNC